jgi:hypothetical protein
MCDPISAITGGLTLFKGVQSIFGGDPASKAADSAARNSDAQLKATQDAERRASEDLNRRNAKRADASMIDSAAGAAGQMGEAGTMLTGPSGVDPNSLKLGKQTLLGY